MKRDIEDGLKWEESKEEKLWENRDLGRSCTDPPRAEMSEDK